MPKNSVSTIYDVARLAGVSVATVSKALNHRSGVNIKTAEKINQILAETGFERRWKANDSAVIGIVIPPYDGVLLDSYDSAVLSYCCDNLMKSGYSLQFICRSQTVGMKYRSYLGSFREKFSGIIAITSRLNYEFCSELLEQNSVLPCVVIGKLHNSPANTLPGSPYHIWANDYEGGYQLATLLLRNGHKRYCVSSASLKDISHSHRVEGIRAALSDGGIPSKDIIFQEFPECLRDNGHKLAVAMACQKNYPDAFLFTNGALCTGFVTGCYDLKLHIPQDFSVAGFEDNGELSLLPTPITSMCTPSSQLGEQAVKILLAQIERTPLPQSQRISHQLCIRNSVASR